MIEDPFRQLFHKFSQFFGNELAQFTFTLHVSTLFIIIIITGGGGEKETLSERLCLYCPQQQGL